MAEAPRKKSTRAAEMTPEERAAKRRRLEELIALKKQQDLREAADESEPQGPATAAPSQAVAITKPVARAVQPPTKAKATSRAPSQSSGGGEMVRQRPAAVKKPVAQEPEDEEWVEEEEDEGDDEMSLDDLDNVLASVESQLNAMASYDAELESGLDEELKSLQTEIAEEGSEASILEQLLQVHPWIAETQYGFMYAIPDKKKKKQDYESWVNDWANVVLDYARIAVLHVLSLNDVSTEEPFSKFYDRAGAVDNIFEELIRRKVAEWKNKKSKLLRVYWRTIDEWAHDVVTWARDMGLTEMIFAEDLRNSLERFHNLPAEDIDQIFKLIKKQNEGELIKLDTGGFAVKIKML